jgi:hypothetical protein
MAHLDNHPASSEAEAEIGSGPAASRFSPPLEAEKQIDAAPASAPLLMQRMQWMRRWRAIPRTGIA